MKAIPFYPVLRPQRLVGPPGTLPSALGAPGAVRLRWARSGLKLLAEELEPGPVLLPDFICTSAVAPFAAAGHEVRHYRIGPGLEPDLEGLERLLGESRVTAVMAISYFGLAQPFPEMRELCANAGAVLIDDAAHSLLSEIDGRAFGTFGDAGVVGIHKTLPVPDGAVLVLTGLGRAVEAPDKPSPSFPGAYWLRTLLRNVDELIGLDVMGRRARRLSGQLPTHEDPAVRETGSWSRLTERVVHRIDPAAERDVRRRAFEAWRPLLAGSGGTPVGRIGEDPGVCPSGMPVRIDDEQHFVRWAHETRVEWIRWPDRSQLSSEFPWGLAVLPTHTVPR